MSALPYHRMPGFGDLGYPYDDAEDSRAEELEERTTEMFDQYAADDAKVLEGVELVSTLGFDGLLDRAVRDFLLDWNKGRDDDATAVRDAALRLHERIWPHVEKYLRGEAALDAEMELERFEANGPDGDAA